MTDRSAIEAMARAIAQASGDDFDEAFTDLSHWRAEQGMRNGWYRDEYGLFQCDYLKMATAALTALAENITPGMVEAYWDRCDSGGDLKDDRQPGEDSGAHIKRVFRAMCAAAVKGEE